MELDILFVVSCLEVYHHEGSCISENIGARHEKTLDLNDIINHVLGNNRCVGSIDLNSAKCGLRMVITCFHTSNCAINRLGEIQFR